MTPAYAARVNLHVLRGERITNLVSGDTFADLLPTDLLTSAAAFAAPRSGRAVAWSGRVDEGDGPGVRTWGAPGRAALMSCCDRLEPVLRAARAAVLLRPHARHVLSDVPACAGFLRERARGPFGVLVDPVSMLTAPMLARAIDHVERTVDALIPLPGVAGVVISNADRGADGDVRAVPITRGVLDPDALSRLIRRAVPGDLPLVLVDDDVDAQASLLGA